MSTEQPAIVLSMSEQLSHLDRSLQRANELAMAQVTKGHNNEVEVLVYINHSLSALARLKTSLEKQTT